VSQPPARGIVIRQCTARQDLESFGERICIFGRKLHTAKGSAFIEEWLGKPVADRNWQDYGRFQQIYAALSRARTANARHTRVKTPKANPSSSRIAGAPVPSRV
jgi:hypothetical protein